MNVKKLIIKINKRQKTKIYQLKTKLTGKNLIELNK